jgi:hypothetical protein
MNWPRSYPSQHKPTREWLGIWIRLNRFAGGHHVPHIIVTDPSLEHALQGMNPEDQRVHRQTLGLIFFQELRHV